MAWRTSRAVAAALVTVATFADLVAYSVCVPVLPDLARKLGASPTAIGLLFASFAVTLLIVSVPMGALSDRTGRTVPLVGSMLALAGATLLFAHADSLLLLVAARMVQGAADGVAWAVGFALIADAYGPEERGRVMGYVMSGTSVGIMIGPPLGGWLYQAGGMALPFECVAALALACAIGFMFIRPNAVARHETPPSIWSIVRVPRVAACTAAVVVTGATVAMLEPILALFFSRNLGLSPARVGATFGVAAIALTVMPFVYGPMADRWGGRPLTLIGLAATAVWMPFLTLASSFPTAVVLILVQWLAIALVVTPSLAYMAEVTAFAGGDAYGAGYGLYNTAWAIGLLGGPSLGGWLFERLGFGPLIVGWSAVVLALTLALWRVTIAERWRLS